MHPYRRALGAVAIAALLSSGLTAGAVAAEADPASADAAVVEELVGLVLTGTGGGVGSAVGQVLSTSQPTALPLGIPAITGWHVEWLRDGQVVAAGEDLWTYTTTLQDAGHAITARVTGSVPLLGPVVRGVTNAVPVAAVPGGEEPLAVATPPTVTGTPEVGRTVSATDPRWRDTDGVTHTYQWLRGGASIPGATARTYELTPDDLDQAVAVAVTGTKQGRTAGTAESAPVTVARGDALEHTVAPSVSGTPALGRTLAAEPGAWGTGPTPTYTFQWRRNGVPLDGATGATYDVALADVAQALSVTVTATRPAYEPGSATTSPVTVARLAGTTTASLARERIARSRAAVLRVATRTVAGFVPGKVTVRDGSRKLRTVTVGASATRIRLERLRPGVHRLRVVHLGNQYVAPSRSRVLRLVVGR